MKNEKNQNQSQNRNKAQNQNTNRANSYQSNQQAQNCHKNHSENTDGRESEAVDKPAAAFYLLFFSVLRSMTSAIARSAGVVILILSVPQSTSFTGKPTRSASILSSVAEKPSAFAV